MRIPHVTSIALAITTSFSVQAQLGDIKTPSVAPLNQRTQPGPASVPPFSALDTNDDRVISQNEATADMTVSRYFMRADSNRDRVLSRPEYLALSRGGR
ncbi:MAG: hypothetical protein KAG72_02675 [Abyssibacter sp.]|jgi:hypothetical protein|nr:hypothetical protein [Abyssibacter sp.]MCK5858226.1 hypothetical protein [Abyssibacter sp.]